jgi:thymidylate kinase
MDLKIVKDFINKLNDEKILYCHWKSNQHVGDAFKGIDDIDMLIAQEDILKLNIVLNELGYKRFRLPEKRAYVGIEDYLGFDKETGKFVHLHLHYQLTLGEKFLKGYQLPYSKSILKRRIFDKENQIYTTSYEDEMWLLLLRAALKLRHRDYIKLLINKDIIGSSTHREFKWLKDNLNIEQFKQTAQNILGSEVSNQMIRIVDRGLSFYLIMNLNIDLRHVIAPFKSYSKTGGTLTRWSREYFRVSQVFHNKIYKELKSYRRTPISGGKTIAFLGPDGAGKSTVIREVNKRLGMVIDVNQFYLGSGDGQSSLLRKPLKLMYSMLLKRGTLNRKSKKVDSSGITHREGENKLAKTIRSLGQIPWTYSLARERRRKILKARRFRSKGYIVLTDRYPQTQVKDMCDGPRFYLNDAVSKEILFNRVLNTIEKNSFRIAELVKPDLVVILKVSSEVAYKRKPDEIDIISHKNLMNTILEVKFGEDTKRIIVDADQEFESVINETLSAIWECM